MQLCTAGDYATIVALIDKSCMCLLWKLSSSPCLLTSGQTLLINFPFSSSVTELPLDELWSVRLNLR